MDEEEIMRAWGLEDESEEPDEELDEGLEDEDEDPDEEPDEEPEDEDPDEDDGGSEEEDPEDGGEDPLQSARERIEEEGREQVTAALDAQIAAMGLLDPYNDNSPITTKAQHAAYLKAHANARFDNLARQGGMTRQELDALIGQHPDVVAAQQLKAQLEQQSAAQARQQAQRALDAQIAQIGKLCSGVDTREAVVNHESWPKVKKLMEDNPKLGVLDAFRLANAEAIEAGIGRKAQAAAKRNAAGKRHMRSTGGRGEGGIEVPPEVKAIYRAWEPDITEAEMRKAYAADMKNK